MNDRLAMILGGSCRREAAAANADGAAAVRAHGAHRGDRGRPGHQAAGGGDGGGPHFTSPGLDLGAARRLGETRRLLNSSPSSAAGSSTAWASSTTSSCMDGIL